MNQFVVCDLGEYTRPVTICVSSVECSLGPNTNYYWWETTCERHTVCDMTPEMHLIPTIRSVVGNNRCKRSILLPPWLPDWLGSNLDPPDWGCSFENRCDDITETLQTEPLGCHVDPSTGRELLVNRSIRNHRVGVGEMGDIWVPFFMWRKADLMTETTRKEVQGWL